MLHYLIYCPYTGITSATSFLLAMLFRLTALCLLLVVVHAAQPLPSARGWGDGIEWYSYSEGLAQAKETGKDMLFLFHSTRCGACKRLMPDFAANKQIEELSKNFVMVNVENEEEGSSNQLFLGECILHP